MTALKVSIVIPTYNRRKKLNRLLKSIVESNPKRNYEVIIVDDTPSENSLEQENKEALKERLQLIRNPGRTFISKSKNLGGRRARGEYVFFIDDDNVLPPETMELLTSKLDGNPQIGALMPVVYYEKRREVVWVYATPFSRSRWSFELLGRNATEKRKPLGELLPTDALPNAFIVRRNLLEQVGGFDESLPINSSCDFCQKIKKTGHEAFALTTASIYHDVTPPNIPGYWAGHAAGDTERRYYEVRDWFSLMARLHGAEGMLVVKEFLRSIPFLIEVGIGVLLHPPSGERRILAVYGSMLRGLIDGTRVAALHGL